MTENPEVRWQRLMVLLEPMHERALASARRLGRSTAEGDDLYQETVLRAFEKLHTLRDESRFGAWFYATLLSRHRTRYRRSFWRRFLPWEDAFPGDGPPGEDGQEREGRSLEAGRAARALATLVPEQREAIVLFEIDGYSIMEIAAMQGASVPAVKSRLKRGREALRRHYQREIRVRDRAATEATAGGTSLSAARAVEHEVAGRIGFAAPSTSGKERTDG